MSKLGSKEEILSGIQSLLEKLQSNNLTADGMESLVELTRELHERALILRYKSYEEKIFGVRTSTSASEIETDNQEAENFSAEEVLLEESNGMDETTASTPVEAQHAMGFEEIEAEMLAEESPLEEPVFDFDMFEKAEAASSVTEPLFNAHTDMEEEAKRSENQVSTENDNLFNVANNAATDTTNDPITPTHDEIQQTETMQIADEVEESSATVSESVNLHTDQDTETVPALEREEEIPLPEELALMNEPVIIPEKTPEVQPTSENDMFRRFSGGNSDDSLSSRLSATKLHTLNGAFGLNEKLQCIRELFKGSSEAFNQAIETLDKQDNFSDAKRILAQYAQQNSWNLESNLTSEFIQKIERRFL